MAKSRSPEYPAIGLREAVEKVRSAYSGGIYQSLVSKKALAEAMGYKSLSGASLPVLSALAKYGLIEGRAGDTRISDLAVSIIAHEPGTPERAKAIRDAASKPELFVDIDGRSHNGKTTDAAIRSYLLTRKFIPPAADAAIRAYRETKGLVEAESDGHNIPAGKQELPTSIEVGDLIQVEIGGDLRLPRVRAVQEHEGRQWVFIEGSESGIPVEQAILEHKGQSDPPPRPLNSPRLPEEKPPQGTRREVFALDEGDVVITFPETLSADSFADLKAYLEVFVKKVQRRAKALSGPSEVFPPSGDGLPPMNPNDLVSTPELPTKG